MSKRSTVGQIIDGLGVKGEAIDEDSLVSDAIVLMKCIGPTGAIELRMASSQGMSALERLGMLRAAERMEGAKYSWGGE